MTKKEIKTNPTYSFNRDNAEKFIYLDFAVLAPGHIHRVTINSFRDKHAS